MQVFECVCGQKFEKCQLNNISIRENKSFALEGVDCDEGGSLTLCGETLHETQFDENNNKKNWSAQ